MNRTVNRTLSLEKENQILAFANFLRLKRIQARLSQIKVSEILEYNSSQFISNWERGISYPPINTLKILCGLYNVDPDLMFEYYLGSTLISVEEDLKNKFFNNAA